MKKHTMGIVVALLFLMTLFGGLGCDYNETEPGGETGPYQTAENLSSGPAGASGLFYPTDSPPNVKLPIYIFGCGGSLTPSFYTSGLTHIASYGFVVVAQISTGTGTELTNAIDWIIEENDRSESPLYQKMDTTKIAAGGHSLGSVSTFAIADDPRLTTTIHVAGGSLDGEGSGALNLRNPAAYFNGENDNTGATDNAALDYAVTTVPVFFGVMAGINHLQSPPESIPAVTSWLRWHLKGEVSLEKEFLDEAGAFRTGRWNSQVKNW